MSQKVYLSAPIAKVNETADGGREVWGFATLERVDKSGEIADFDGTVKAFEKWSSEIEKRTNGKSKGNVRVMHQPVVAGKTIHWEPAETTVQKDDGSSETVKAIWVGAYVPPTKPEVIKDVDEGILSGFSIGGAYAKRWWDDTNKAFRYIPDLAEYSLVDNPCVPGADIVNVFEKAAGPWEKPEVKDMVKAAQGSFEDLADKLYDAVRDKLSNPFQPFDGYLVATWPDHFIMRDWCNDTFWDITYTTDAEGCIQLGDIKEVQRVESFVPVEAMKALNAELQKKDASKDELKQAAEARADKYGIAFKEGKGHLTPPKGYPTDESEYGDPVNYAYPIDDSRVKAAVSYFNHDGQREAGGYSEEEWEKIGKRIAAAAKRVEGGDYTYADGKIAVPDNKTEKGSDTGMKIEELQKAAEQAGITVEQMTAFFKALNPEEAPAAPTNVPTVDGDGDGDKNKEFPNPPDNPVNIPGAQADVKAAESESGVAAKEGAPVEEQKPADPLKAAGDDLAKAGKAISGKRMMHLQHAANHIKAAMDGSEYGPEHHMQVENSTVSEGTNTGEEAPEVTTKTFTGLLQKTVGDLVTGELSKIEALFKGVATGEALAKALDSVTKITERMESLETMVKAIHDTPQVGGPMLHGGSPDIFKMGVAGVNVQAMEDQTIEKFLSEVKDPLLKDKIGQEIAIRRAKQGMK